MRFYAERPVRAARQGLADLLVVGWIVLCVVVALAVRDQIQLLQQPGRTLTEAGDGIRGTFEDAARTAGEVPFVGDDLAGAFGPGIAAGDSLAVAGGQLVETVSAVALAVAVAIILLGVLPVLAVWLTLRIRYALAAQAAVTVRTADTDLLALRALAHVPVRRLLAVSADPASAWRRDDREVVHRLAALELRSLGLLPPPAPPD